MIVRWGTAEDVRRACGFDLPTTGRVRVAEQDGEIIGIAGWYRMGDIAFVFSEARPQMKRFPKVILREAKALMASIKLPAVCTADRDEPGACRFLERLGWVHAGSRGGHEVYAWRS